MYGRPSPDQTSRRGAALRRLPVAIAGLAALIFALLLLGGSPPSSEVLGILGTPAVPATPHGSLGKAAHAVAATQGPALALRPAPGPAGSAAPAVPAVPAAPDGDERHSRPGSASVGESRSPARGLAPAPGTLSGYAWPIQNARLTLPFGPSAWGSRVVDGGPFHDGIDLATFCGDQVTAAHTGVVLAAGRRFDEFLGWLGDLTPYNDRLEAEHLRGSLPIVVVIDDGNGYRSTYAHFRRLVVKAGDVVEAGDLLGYEGATGRASGCHLHYGLFSPEETDVFGLDPEAAAHMLLPPELVARIDPLIVLPPPETAGIR